MAGKRAVKALPAAAPRAARLLKSKEKKEILFIIGIVVVVAVLGLILTQLAASRASAIAGAAFRPSADLPTTAGLLILLQEAKVVSGVGTCNFLCQEKACLPVEDSCNIYKVSNDCFCVSPPESEGIGEGQSYESLISYLQEAEVVREEGICNALCSNRGKACLIANGGAKICEEVASQCICR